MTLLITTFAAIITFIIWYNRDFDGSMMLGTLCLMYLGASAMWFVDAVVEYMEIGAEYFTPNGADMLNDGFLGLSVVALGLIIWLIILIIKDPEGKVKRALKRNC